MSELESVEVAVSPREKFQEYLATQEMRLTQERSIIVDDVFSQHEHFDADQIVERLTAQKGGRRVSRSSVYRTLTLLEEAGLIRKVARSDGRDVYEHDYGYPQHDHLYCEKCEKLIEFHSDEVAQIRDAVAREHGFRVTSHRLIIEGVCKDCQQITRKRPRRLDRI